MSRRRHYERHRSAQDKLFHFHFLHKAVPGFTLLTPGFQHIGRKQLSGLPEKGRTSSIGINTISMAKFDDNFLTVLSNGMTDYAKTL
ncbi:hypothetical protein ACC697_38730, partial [Rhizobium ruizarguesonis]